MKVIPGFTPFQYQKVSISHISDIVELNNTAFIFDETGLGKTITSLTAAINLANRILVISPKANQKSWIYIARVAMDTFSDLDIVVTTAQSSHKLESDEFELVIVDEVHNFRNIKSKTHRAVFNIIHKNFAKSLMLTATPFNNNFTEIKAICSLVCFSNTSIGYHTLGGCLDNILISEKKLSIFDRFDLRWASFKHIGEVVTLEHILNAQVKTLVDILSYISIRNSRDVIKSTYPDDVQAMGTFPIINNVEKYVVTYTNEFYQAINTTVAILYKMPLARQNIINYVIFKPGANKVENADFRGIYKSLLFKRMESSVASFKRTVERGLSGIEEIKKSITDSTIDFGGTKYSFYNQNIFLLDLDKDAVGFTQILELWNEITDESKTDVLVEMLSETKGKTIVFTEYKDTFDEIRSVLGNKALYYDSSTPDAVLDTVRTEFDNNVPVSEQTNKYNILVCTDVLSEGVNMHRADNVVHFDNKWNPSKITQRNGRVDRITINSSKIKEINIFTFGVDSSIESIIELQNKIDDKTYWGDLFKTISYNDCDYRFERYRDGYTLSVAQDGTGVRISKVVRTPKYDFIYSDSSFIIGHQVPIVFSSKKKFESSDIHGYINDPIIDYAPASRRSDYTHMVLREGKLLKEPIRNYLLNSLYSGIYEAIIKEYLEKDKNIFKNVIEYITDLNQKYSTIVKPENYMGIAYTENGLVYTHHVLESI